MIKNKNSIRFKKKKKGTLQWNNTFKILQINYLKPRILYAAILSIKYDVEKDNFRYTSLQKIHFTGTLCHKDIESCIPQKPGSKLKLGKSQNPRNRRPITRET